jgi:hypothetical protein
VIAKTQKAANTMLGSNSFLFKTTTPTPLIACDGRAGEGAPAGAVR